MIKKILAVVVGCLSHFLKVGFEPILATRHYSRCYCYKNCMDWLKPGPWQVLLGLFQLLRKRPLGT